MFTLFEVIIGSLLRSWIYALITKSAIKTTRQILLTFEPEKEFTRKDWEEFVKPSYVQMLKSVS
jgi:hypothetical protein